MLSRGGKAVNEYEKVEVLDNNFEAQVLDSILNERQIPHLMRSFYDTAFDGLFQTQKGWGYVSAPWEYHEEIKEVLRDLRNNEPGPTDEGQPENTGNVAP